MNEWKGVLRDYKWVWCVLGFLVVFMLVKWTGLLDNPQPTIEERIKEQVLVENLDELINLIREERYDELDRFLDELEAKIEEKRKGGIPPISSHEVNRKEKSHGYQKSQGRI